MTLLIYKIVFKEKDKIIIFEVGYSLSAAIMLLVDKLWLTDGDLMAAIIFATFPLHLLIQFFILIVEKPKDSTKDQ